MEQDQLAHYCRKICLMMKVVVKIHFVTPKIGCITQNTGHRKVQLPRLENNGWGRDVHKVFARLVLVLKCLNFQALAVFDLFSVALVANDQYPWAVSGASRNLIPQLLNLTINLPIVELTENGNKNQRCINQLSAALCYQ